jgi:tetratricopeptide (TPR) repeat protein
MWAITLALVVSAQLGDAAARLPQGVHLRGSDSDGQAGGQACDGQLAQARDAYERRQYEQARAGFAAALTLCDMQPPILLALAQAELLARDVAAALATLDRLATLGPLSVPALKVRAKALYLSARDRDAEDALLTAAAKAPGDAEIPYDLGRIYYQQQRHQDARRAFRQAIASDARAYKAWDNLGLTYEALGDVEEAMRHYARAMAIAQTDAPTYDVVYANYADLLIKEGQYKSAFNAAAEAAQRNPRDARNFLLAGKALVRLEAIDVSIKWLTQAVTLDPDYPEPHYLLARAYRQIGAIEQAQAAMAAFQAASARAPKVRR